MSYVKFMARLYWRLAKNRDNDTKEVLVPGTFYKANCAIPIAPEPLTNYVLSNLMPGLLSEFVTGTPMAPLTGIGNIYIGIPPKIPRIMKRLSHYAHEKSTSQWC
jgi:hypothetical protein